MRLVMIIFVSVMLSGCAAINNTRMANSRIRIMHLREKCLAEQLNSAEIDCSQFTPYAYAKGNSITKKNR